MSYFNSFSQDFNLETFDSKQSIKSWKIKNNGVMLHTNHFTYNGQTYYKPSKDSFLVFYDDTDTFSQYRVLLSKTFKAIPAEEINFHYSIYSNDTFQDYLSLGCRIFDKNR